MSPIKGPTMKCLAHLHRVLRNEPDFYDKRKRIAEFVAVGEQAVTSWFTGKHPPVGSALLRARYYLEFLGYQVDELQNLNQAVNATGRLFTFKVLTLEEIAGMVGYAEGRNGVDATLAVLRGVHTPSREKIAHLEALVELYKEKLPDALKRAPRVLDGVAERPSLQQKPAGKQTNAVLSVPPVDASAMSTPFDVKDALIESFANSIKAMLPLAEYLISRCTPEDRDKLRKLADGNGVFRLSTRLNRLCSETARRELNRA